MVKDVKKGLGYEFKMQLWKGVPSSVIWEIQEDYVQL